MKVPLYAQNGIAEVWLVDLTAAIIEIYRQPSATGYKQLQRRKRGQGFAPQAFPQLEMTVNEILG
jgi:Uma2 family endonuclease